MHSYYKPKTLTIGIIIFAFSCISLGYLYGLPQTKAYQWTLSFIALAIGEGLILDSASYKTQTSRKVSK